MKVLAQILIAVSLTLGVLAAASAYLAPVSLGPALAGLTLGAPAGRDGNDPILKAEEKLTPENIERLAKSGVTHVKVKEFHWGDLVRRWPGRWWFVGAVGGLGLGAFLVRRASRAAINAALRPDAAGRPGVMSPDDALAGLRSMIASIERDVALHADDSARMTVIADRIDEAQKTFIDSFLQSRSILQGRLGSSGFAMLMDRFSIGERQLNRAWSAAVDGVYAESIACVREADGYLAQAQKRLSR